MNYSRNELIQTEATMNQMRNSIYGLARFMEKSGISNLTTKLRQMGQNIARTYINYWKPTNSISVSNIKDVLTTTYQLILNSSVSIEINDVDNLISVQDYKCALCKYHYNDIEIAGCEIIIGMISELISIISKSSNNSEAIFLEPFEVKDSRAYGNKSCIHLYKFKIGKGD